MMKFELSRNKKVISLLFAVVIAISFSACENKSKKKNNSSNIETMIINEKYSLNVGDEIQKITDDAKLKISQNSESDVTTYELIKGGAEIIRK